MRGILQGEESAGTTPLLQLFCRLEQLLADMHSGTYLIEDITGTSPSTRASGSFNTALVAGGGHKLGTGRYVIPTGSTVAWAVGTHRITSTYRMSAGGADHKQVSFFEVLDTDEFATSLDFVTYLTSKQAAADGLVTGTTGEIQAMLADAASQIEEWTGNWFEPRHMTLVLSGDKRKVLYLNVPIIAIETLETVSKDSSGNETRYDWNSAYWRAYNRHLDGLRSPDDRYNPAIELIMADPALCTSDDSYLDWTWPFGQQNIEITGVFGYTDPAPDRNAPGLSLGVMPRVLRRLMNAIMVRSNEDLGLEDPSTQQPGRIKEYKTRHQKIVFFGSSSQGSQYGSISGDPLLDQLLLRLCKPVNAGYVQRRYE